MISLAHFWHSKDPPCAKQALILLSTSHVGSEDVEGAVVVVGGIVDVLVLGGFTGHSSQWHLFSY